MNIDCPALECIWAAMQQKSDCVLRLAGIGTLKCSSRILRRSSSQTLRIVVLFVLELWERTKIWLPTRQRIWRKKTRKVTHSQRLVSAWRRLAKLLWVSGKRLYRDFGIQQMAYGRGPDV